MESAEPRTLRLLAVTEASTVTGAAKSLLDFCRASNALSRATGEPRVETSVVTFERTRRDADSVHARTPDDESRASDGEPRASVETTLASEGARNAFVAAALAFGLEVDVIEEGFRFDPRAVRGLRRVVERRAPDLVVTCHVKSHFLALVSGLRRRRAWVAYHHGYTSTDRKMLAYNRLDRWSLPAADRVVTVCEAFARELEERRGVAREKIFVQHNSITQGRRVGADEVRSLRARLRIKEDERVLLTIGRLSREKAQADLLRAFKLLTRGAQSSEGVRSADGRRDAGGRVRLVVVGDGPERASLERLARELGLDQQIVFAGQSGDVAPFYAAADAFALPSHSEGSPYVLLEAMAAGLPVVATAVGGVPEILSDEESALLVAPRDEAAMARALSRILSDRELARALTTKASALAATRHAPETYARALARLYDDVITNSRAARGK
jgi:glycosyltransferase involved in cell wall biosynthesis